jgi:hypothetical protein
MEIPATTFGLRDRRARAWVSGLGFVLWLGAGCGNDPSEPAPNVPPETFITSGEPRDSSRVVHHVTLHWNGQDIDGTVPRTFDTFSTATRAASRRSRRSSRTRQRWNDSRWTRVSAYQITLAVPADTLRADPRGDIGLGEFDRWPHVLSARHRQRGRTGREPGSAHLPGLHPSPGPCGCWRRHAALPS